jgi:eukaryotic-like serine/threonine-protein kinase
MKSIILWLISVEYLQPYLAILAFAPPMSYCLNSTCQKPENSPESSTCANCGTSLLLKQRYRACRFLDAGGMSRAYLAIDEDTPSRQICVIKQFFPAPHVASNPKSFGKSLELFSREATQLDKLGRESPQIPKLLAYLEQDQKFYLVQEFIDGRNLLRDLVANGPYSEEDLRQLLLKILPVLKFVHGHNIAHRDIKPENIMRRQNGELVLIDFGLSKQLTDTVSSRGTTGGTMGYAPPEQIRAGIAYPATDLFALGATCIHLLTGVTPDNLYDFQQNRWTWRDLLEKSQRYVSDNLTEILDKMLQTEVKNRYQSASEVLADLANPLTRTVQARRRKGVLALAAMTPVIASLFVVAVYSEQIKCHIGMETSYCLSDLGPKTYGDVLYFPFAPAKDTNGKSAEFNMAILSQQYRWHKTSSSAVTLGKNDPPRLVKDLKADLEKIGITKIMENPNQIIAIGMASCEGSAREEELRALERAITIREELSKTIFDVAGYPVLNLGQFKKDTCSKNVEDNAFQRSMIIVGIRRASPGLVMNEALHARLTKISKDFKIGDYSLGSKENLQFLIDEKATIAKKAKLISEINGDVTATGDPNKGN